MEITFNFKKKTIVINGETNLGKVVKRLESMNIDLDEWKLIPTTEVVTIEKVQLRPILPSIFDSPYKYSREIDKWDLIKGPTCKLDLS